MTFGADSRGTQRKNPDDFCYLQTFHLVHHLVKIKMCPALSFV